MHCTNCGRELSAGARFCPACGAPVVRDVQSQQPPTGQPQSQATQQSHVATKILAAIAFVLLLACVALGTYLLVRKPGVASQPVVQQETSREDASSGNKEKREGSGTKEGSGASSTEESESDKTSEAAAPSVEEEHARLREEAESRGMQVLEGTFRATTLYDYAMEKGGESLASNFSSNGGENLYVLELDGSQTVTGKSGDGMGTRSADVTCIELDSGDGPLPEDGSRMCIAYYPDSAWFSSSVKYDVVPVHTTWELLYSE